MARLSEQPTWQRQQTRKVRLTRPPHIRIRRRWRYYYFRLMRLRGTPEAIARGLAVGAFAGMFPIMGFQIIFGVLLAILFRGNKIIAAAATWISNPLTYIPLFAFNFQIGQWLLRTNHLSFNQLDNIRDPHQLLQLSGGFLATLFVGCLLMGTFAAVLSYISGHWIIGRLRKQYRKRQRQRKLKRSAKAGGCANSPSAASAQRGLEKR